MMRAQLNSTARPSRRSRRPPGRPLGAPLLRPWLPLSSSSRPSFPRPEGPGWRSSAPRSGSSPMGWAPQPLGAGGARPAGES
eukprot:14465305-Alexandrium_andersonii.AAC.1